MQKNKMPVPTEAQEQMTLFSWAAILKEIKTARRWRNKIVNDMAVCVFGIPAAVSAATYRKAVDK